MSITISLARCAPWLSGALAFFGVFFLCHQYVLHDFYNLGATRDTYWFAGLFWQNGWLMTDPPAASFFPDGSFFYTHLSPFIYLPNALSYLFSMGPTRWYALVYGLMHASLTLGVFCLLRTMLPPWKTASPLAALLAAAFAFNGNAVVALQMPHFEIAIPALMLLMLALMCTARFGWASVALAATLTLREDAGFHVVALLATALVVRRYFASNFQFSSMDRWAVRFVIVALCYSLAAFLLQRILYGDNGMLWNNYLGSPPFAHMTHDVLSQRLHLYLQERSYIWAPFLLTLVWAALARNPLIPLGFVAELPWLALHFTAKVPVVGEMAWYYGFPFIVSIAWPLVAVWWWRGGLPTARERRQTSAAFVLVLASTLVGQVQERFIIYPLALFSNVSPVGTVMAATDTFVASVWTNRAELGHLRVDPGVRGLAPQRFAAQYWLESPLQGDSTVDSIIWFDPGARDSDAWATWINQRLNYHYEIPGTPLVMASNRRPEQLPALRPLIKPTSLLMRRLQPTAIAQRTTEGIVVRDTAISGPVTTGPYIGRETGLYRVHSMSLPTGQYEIALRLKLAAHPPANDFDALLGVWLEYPWAEERVRLNVQSNKVRLLPSGDYEIVLPFQVDETQASSHWTGLFNLVLEHYANSEQWILRDVHLISQ